MRKTAGSQGQKDGLVRTKLLAFLPECVACRKLASDTVLESSREGITALGGHMPTSEQVTPVPAQGELVNIAGAQDVVHPTPNSNLSSGRHT